MRQFQENGGAQHRWSVRRDIQQFGDLHNLLKSKMRKQVHTNDWNGQWNYLELNRLSTPPVSRHPNTITSFELSPLHS